MYKNIFAFLLLSILSFEVYSQEGKDAISRLERGEDLKVIYRNEASFGVFVHSAGGIGIAYRRGRQVNVDRKRMLEVEMQNFKHPKEVKSMNSDNSQGYIYGKLNSVLLVRAGFGYQNILFQKTEKKNIEIRYSTFLGATLAFAKPVYLEITQVDTLQQSGSNQPETQRYNPEYVKQEEIFGKAPFFKGIGNTKIVPGAYGKLALSFEYGERYNLIKAIETGVVADFYPQALEIMAFNKKQNIYVSLYLKMIWGKKWF